MSLEIQFRCGILFFNAKLSHQRRAGNLVLRGDLGCFERPIRNAGRRNSERFSHPSSKAIDFHLSDARLLLSDQAHCCNEKEEQRAVSDQKGGLQQIMQYHK